jgi:Mg/Co/Ni transporter MgtE
MYLNLLKSYKVIVDHFDKIPSSNRKKFMIILKFKQCFEIIKQREHFKKKGLLKLIGLKSSLI